MKARVKATGEIVRIEGCASVFHYGKLLDGYIDTEGVKYLPSELEFDVKEKSFSKDEPDYWDKLRHQTTIDFMKSFLDKYDGTVNIESLLRNAIKLATALVNKLKEESQC